MKITVGKLKQIIREASGNRPPSFPRSKMMQGFKWANPDYEVAGFSDDPCTICKGTGTLPGLDRDGKANETLCHRCDGAGNEMTPDEEDRRKKALARQIADEMAEEALARKRERRRR